MSESTGKKQWHVEGKNQCPHIASCFSDVRRMPQYRCQDCNSFCKIDPLDSSRFHGSLWFGFIQVYVPSFYTGQIRNASFIESIRNCLAMLL